jgi:hypothetical protein
MKPLATAYGRSLQMAAMKYCLSLSRKISGCSWTCRGIRNSTKRHGLAIRRFRLKSVSVADWLLFDPIFGCLCACAPEFLRFWVATRVNPQRLRGSERSPGPGQEEWQDMDRCPTERGRYALLVERDRLRCFRDQPVETRIAAQLIPARI